MFKPQFYDPKNMYSMQIGGVGFAQLGQEYYKDKSDVEKDVIFVSIDKDDRLRPPKEFQHAVRYTWQSNQHDFGVYYDLHLYYDQRIDDQVEHSDEMRARQERFYDWFEGVQSFDFEGELYQACEDRYAELYPERIVVEYEEEEDDEFYD